MITASLVVHKTPPEQLTKALSCLNLSGIDRIYVVDNSPQDSLRNVVSAYRNLEYIFTENKGFGSGHNIAINKAIKSGTDYHLVMNADVWWKGDVIDKMIKFMEKNPRVGLMAPKIFYPDGTLQYSCRMLPTPLDLFLKRFTPERMFRKRKGRYLLNQHDHEFPLKCPYLLGSFLLFRKKALVQSGLFDERFFMYPEDIDISRRIHKNWDTIYWPAVSIIHEHQAASRKNIKMLGIHLRNMIKYFNKWGWWKDKERNLLNNELLKSIHRLPGGKLEKGRG